MDLKNHPDLMNKRSKTWLTLENLIAPDPDLRESALEELAELECCQEQPLIVYLLATRLLDPELEIRFYTARILGGWVNFDCPSQVLTEKSLSILTGFTNQLDQSQLVKLLEVSAAYLAAEGAVGNILKMCSYAGKALGGIVNDRTIPVEIRQQAIFYCGEVGFLNSEIAIRNLIQRVQKNQARAGFIPTRKKHLDEEHLLPFAVAALGKLEGS